MMIFRKACSEDTDAIWKILKNAIERRKKDGSQQWQNGYPNPESIKNDLQNEHGYVLESDSEIAVYSAIIKNYEPAYHKIEGKWLSDGEFLVIHRVAVSENFLGKGLVKMMFLEFENFAISQNIRSIKIDTSYDNAAMLHLLKKMNYSYCGEVIMGGSPRKAFEKLL